MRKAGLLIIFGTFGLCGLLLVLWLAGLLLGVGGGLIHLLLVLAMLLVPVGLIAGAVLLAVDAAKGKRPTGQ